MNLQTPSVFVFVAKTYNLASEILSRSPQIVFTVGHSMEHNISLDVPSSLAGSKI